MTHYNDLKKFQGQSFLGESEESIETNVKASVDRNVALAILQARGKGTPLDDRVRETMNPELASYFEDVRVHTGPVAAESNRQLKARAFTIGSDIFFSPGTYDPDSIEGQKLLFHELVHVVQQKSGQVKDKRIYMSVRPSHDIFEQEADAIAGLVLDKGLRETFNNLFRTKKAITTRGKRHFQSLTIQRTAQGFARCAKTAPPVPSAAHPWRGVHTCHEAALYWELKEQNYQYPDRLLEAIITVTRIGIGTCIPPAWYNRLYQGALRINGRDELRNNVAVGDVLITGTAAQPSHTMVVIKNSKSGLRWRTFIRGFNNYGTLGTGPAAAYGYDNNDRDIDKDKFWHQAGGNNYVFGLQPAAAMPLRRVPYIMYRHRVRNVAFLKSNFDHINKTWAYNQ